MAEPETYVSVDVETAGPVPGRFSMLSLGAVLVGDEEETFYTELQPTSYEVVEEALAVSGLNMEQLGRDGEHPTRAMARFAEWAEALAEGARLVFVGFNAAFDWSFVNWYFHEFVGNNPFGFAPLDIKAYYMGKTGCLWDETRMSRLRSDLKPAEAPSHNALEDAIIQARIFARLLE